MSVAVPNAPWVPAMNFGARLALARYTLDLTLREAAELCGISYRTWASWETGGRRPQDLLDAVTRISEGLGVNREWLAWGEIPDIPERVELSRNNESAGQDRFSGSDIDAFLDAIPQQRVRVPA